MLSHCLSYIKKQTYSNIEVIVVDGNSVDNTREVAKEFTDKVFTFDKKGDYRCAQRNLGVEKASGEYVLVLDSDMELSERVVESCVEKMESDEMIGGLIIPEESFGEGFWAQCKKLEKSFYVGVEWMEAARFFKRSVYQQVGGYDEKMVSGEDWDLSQRIAKVGKIDRVNDFIFHNEGRISLLKTVKKKFYYAQKFAKYTEKHSGSDSEKKQTGVIRRYWLFFSQPMKLLEQPILGAGVLIMKTGEFFVGGLGYLFSYKNNEVRIDQTPVAISEKDLPFISYIIPTYNAEKYLDRCLKGIFQQDYPKEKFEVLVADGNSTDNTSNILKQYSVIVLNNPKRDAESGKYLCLERSKGDLLVLLDSDNVIASKDWLREMVSPLIEDQELFGTESNYLIASDFTSINTYANLLVIVDPLARILASKPVSKVMNPKYIVKKYLKGSAPVAGANGFIWRRTMIDKYWEKSLMKFEEANLLNLISSKQAINIANIPGKGVYHYYCESFFDYLKKRKKIANKFLGRKNVNQETWVDNRGFLRLFFACIFSVSIIGPLAEAIVNMSRRDFQIAWLWHPVISFFTIVLYAWHFFINGIRTFEKYK